MGISLSRDCPISILTKDLDSSHHVDGFKKSLSKLEHFERFLFFLFLVNFYFKNGKQREKQITHIWKTRNPYKKFQGKILKHSRVTAKNVFFLIWALAGHMTIWFRFWWQIWTPLYHTEDFKRNVCQNQSTLKFFNLFTLYGNFLVTWPSNFKSNDRFVLLPSCR